MRKYEKPVIEVVELRPEERLATGYVRTATGTTSTGYTYFITDDTDSNGVIESYFAQKKSVGFGGIFGNLTSFNDFLEAIGLTSINWTRK